ncbi:MAG: protease complex subunit PrcB family protein [Ignavibacteria bacterium]
MKRIIILLAAFLLPLTFSALSITGCSNQGNDEKKLPMEIVMDGTFSAIDDKRELLINDNEKYQSLMGEVYKNLDQMPRIPVIDFTKYSIIAVFTGPKNSGGYLVSIDSVSEGFDISVNVTDTAPGKDCIITQGITKPFSIVKIPRTNKKAVFKTKQIVKDCK